MTRYTKFEEFRTHVPVAMKKAYLESASTGLIPDFVYDGVRRYMDERYYVSGDSTWEIGDTQPHGTLDMMDWAKGNLASMLCCDKNDIVFGQSASQLYSLIVGSFPFVPGQNVVLPEGGYTTTRFAWQVLEQYGLTIRYAKPHNGIVTPEDFFACCDKNTIAICANFVESNTGFKMDLTSLGMYCREKDIFLLVDGVQGLGVMPVNVVEAKADLVVGDDYKWMMGFCGASYAYVSERLIRHLQQRNAGWMSDDERFNTGKQILQLRNDAGRLEMGYPTASGIYAFGLVAQKYNELGRDDIFCYVNGLREYLAQKVSGIPGVNLKYDFPRENCSSIIVIEVDDAVNVSNADFQNAGVVAHLKSSINGKRDIRVALHYYNNTDDIDRLCDVLSLNT